MSAVENEKPSEESATTTSAKDKANISAITTWLMDNYVAAVGVNIPRSTMYDQYCAHCVETRLEAVSSAMFGKVLRTVFPQIKTRRLGNRGQSKYHYCGVQSKHANQLQPNQLTPNAFVAMQQFTSAQPFPIYMPGFAAPHLIPMNGVMPPEDMQPANAEVPADDRLFIPDSLLSEEVPDEAPIRIFDENYRNYCQGILNHAQMLRFPELETYLRTFWNALSEQELALLEDEETVDLMIRYDIITYDVSFYSCIQDC
jgi:regulatory factor X 1/2/3